MARILISGYTNRMTGSKYLRYDYKTFSLILPKILEEMGHIVDHRRVEIGEELYRIYDYAFLGVAPLNSLSAGYVPETHYAMDMMAGRHAVFADDWSFCSFGDSIRYTTERWDGYLQFRRFKYPQAVMSKTKESMENLVNYPLEHNAPVVAPLFTWGDHNFLMKNNYRAKLIDIDPSAWITYPTVNIPKPGGKKRQWVMAALSDHSGWAKKQGFKIPIAYVGNKRLNQAQLSEDEVIQLFANSFGVLSCGYPSKGSGWWRTRYLNAAWAESLIYSDPKDAETMGKSFQGSVEYFENIGSDHEYEVTVEAQIQWLNSHLSSKDLIKKKLEELMRK